MNREIKFRARAIQNGQWIVGILDTSVLKRTMKIIDSLKSRKRKFEAEREGVPYQKRMWYNYRAMLSKDELAEDSFIEIFDKQGRYIDCPGIGGKVIFNNRGSRYMYEIVGFENERADKDWLYASDYINPVVRYVCKMKECREAANHNY